MTEKFEGKMLGQNDTEVPFLTNSTLPLARTFTGDSLSRQASFSHVQARNLLQYENFFR